MTRGLAGRGVVDGIPFWFNRDMAITQNDTATGRHDLEPFWPSRQHHDFDRVCCRARNASAL
ncbi:hypothetical protein [Streptomyces venezuelae]|uniref:Uncharacterized protein n=1 Tax=Streptomyces venezuelae (strain ATCC 10712 / CBS 650.69 / DSM 40230 / JCM 4526 / NBRC 13096 / PD 04745) TaxID=953739 RepID=F2RJF2_STRVP|nr:hypothetical protein vnz_09190 [Streptomyces venezuelae]CCA55162.1 hypothetical protein SVEN_1875 [Streptomyces venezuelae ATCC 10712]